MFFTMTLDFAAHSSASNGVFRRPDQSTPLEHPGTWFAGYLRGRCQMAMDPKQERVLRDGTASKADQPRRIDRESVRAQAERPPVNERPKPRRRTAAVADIRVNLPGGTPVEQLSTALGAERIPELGRSSGPDQEVHQHAPAAAEPERATRERPVVGTSEATRTLKARREHSKGDGNFPSPEP